MGCYKPEIIQNQIQLEPSKLTLKGGELREEARDPGRGHHAAESGQVRGEPEGEGDWAGAEAGTRK